VNDDVRRLFGDVLATFDWCELRIIGDQDRCCLSRILNWAPAAIIGDGGENPHRAVRTQVGSTDIWCRRAKAVVMRCQIMRSTTTQAPGYSAWPIWRLLRSLTARNWSPRPSKS
jgi:hypothetical protein